MVTTLRAHTSPVLAAVGTAVHQIVGLGGNPTVRGGDVAGSLLGHPPAVPAPIPPAVPAATSPTNPRNAVETVHPGSTSEVARQPDQGAARSGPAERLAAAAVRIRSALGRAALLRRSGTPGPEPRQPYQGCPDGASPSGGGGPRAPSAADVTHESGHPAALRLLAAPPPPVAGSAADEPSFSPD